jgi:hypothetical protein
MHSTNWYIFENETVKLWIHPESGSFQLHSVEDEWDDWPYPHKMEYLIKGFLYGIESVNSLESLINLCPINCNHNQIASFVYSTLVEDDLFYAQCEEIFHIKWDPKLSDSLVEIIKQSETGGPHGVAHSSNTYKCKVSKPFNLVIQAIENKLHVTWPRFFKKWENTSEGIEIYQGIISFTSILLNESKCDIPPKSFQS